MQNPNAMMKIRLLVTSLLLSSFAPASPRWLHLSLRAMRIAVITQCAASI